MSVARSHPGYRQADDKASRCNPAPKRSENNDNGSGTQKFFPELRHAEILDGSISGSAKTTKVANAKAAMRSTGMAVQFRDYYETLGVSKTAK